jgi:hypothetical protein
MMKRFMIMKWAVFLSVLFVLIPSVSAFSVSQISVSPTGDLTPGTSVSVSLTIQFAASQGETFPSGSTMDLYTELENPKWSAVLSLNGIESPQPLDSKKNVYLTGWILSYPSSDYEENLRLTLEGVAPAVTQTTNKTIIRVQELDSRNNVVSSSVVTISRMVINTAEVTDLIRIREVDLQAFQTHIDEKAALDIDTSAAEAKYSAAQAAVNDAKSRPSSEYTAAKTSLTNAQNLITDGEKLLDKAWAEKDVADAQVPITKTDDLITWLKPNATSGDYKSKLSEITTKREIAAGFISTANDEIFAGNYERAREKATEAFAKGNESYNDALDLQKQMTEGFNPLGAIGKILGSGTLVIIVGVVAVVLIAVGVIIYRKRTRWDELG